MNAFISIGATGKPAHPREKQLITAGIVAGLLGILQVLAVGSLPNSWGPALAGLYKAGLILYGVVLVAVVIHLLSIHKQLVAIKAVAFLTCVLFFIPMYASHDIDGMLLSYAIAHGCQYMLFMGVTAAGLSVARKSTLMRVLAVTSMLAGAALIGWMSTLPAAWKEATSSAIMPLPAINFLVGAVLGFTMAHFVIDAGIWRLSQKAQREFVGEKFAFLLARSGDKKTAAMQGRAEPCATSPIRP